MIERAIRSLTEEAGLKDQPATTSTPSPATWLMRIEGAADQIGDSGAMWFSRGPSISGVPRILNQLLGASSQFNSTGFHVAKLHRTRLTHTPAPGRSIDRVMRNVTLVPQIHDRPGLVPASIRPASPGLSCSLIRPGGDGSAGDARTPTLNRQGTRPPPPEISK